MTSTNGLDRRAFLTRGVVGGSLLVGATRATDEKKRPALGSATGVAIERAPGERRDVRRSLKWGMVGEGDSVLAKFRMLAELGYDGVELDSPSYADLDEVLAAIEETGVVVPGVVNSMHWIKTLGDRDAAVRAEGVKFLETALRDAKKVGATTVLLVPAVVGPDVSYRDAWERSQAEIRRVLPLAAELGVTIAFENVWNNFLLSPLEAARYVDELESEWVGWYLDIGNVVHYGWPEHWVEALGTRIVKCDVKDYSRGKCNNEGLWHGFDVEIGEGDANYPRVMKALDRIGYRGWFSAEVGGGGRDRLAEVLRRMDAGLQSGT
ncbi:MAG: sugar phosphate isomerase/epimerase family protein [Planctomycetota bacterium]